MRRVYVRTPMAVRFARRLEPQPNGCIHFVGGIRSDGYGEIMGDEDDRRIVLAHRASWMIHRGPIPDGAFVCHHCDNRRCVNPDHLFIGDATANMRDMVGKGRHWSQRKTLCRNGHQLEGDNLATHATGARLCRTCVLAAKTRYNRKVRARDTA